MEPHRYPEYTMFLKRVLTPNRLRHSLGVMQVMEELADVYHLDREQASVTGLLHDAAKDLSPEYRQQLFLEAGIRIDDPCESDYNLYLHGPVGAYYVATELGITDPLVLDAIRFHCFTGEGENFNSPLTWCLRFSDILEPNRDWAHSDFRWFRKGSSRLQEIVYAGRLEEAAFLQTGWLIWCFEEKGMPVHPNYRRIHRELSLRLGLDDTFLEL